MALTASMARGGGHAHPLLKEGSKAAATLNLLHVASDPNLGLGTASSGGC